MKKIYSVLFLTVLIFLSVLVLPSRVWAATFVVNSTVDDFDANPGNGICETLNTGECTMRAAVEESNSLAGADSVVMPLGTYLFTVDGTITISDSVSITGAGQALTFIEQGGFFINAPIALSMSQLTIQNGGNAINNDNGADLTLSNVTISNNFGHGINSFADGSSVTLSNSTISGNSGAGAVSSGLFSPITATDSFITTNGEGGIRTTGAGSPITLTNTSVLNNLASSGVHPGDSGVVLNNVTVSGNAGYGIQSESSGIPSVITNTIVNNNSTGGIFLPGTVDVTNSSVFDNGGPGIIAYFGNTTLTNVTVRANQGDGVTNSGGTLSIYKSAISDHLTVFAAGIFNDGGTMYVENSTISGNNYGVSNNGTTSLLNSTIVNSIAGGFTGGSLVSKNTIIANNSNFDCETFTSITSQGNNIDSDGTCNLTASGDQPNTDPMLGPLQDNGGPTFTHALLTGSPAIDAGNNTGCPTTDQRGITRPQDGNMDLSAICDIGAYEVEALVIPPLPILIDIKPGADPNTIKLGTGGVVTVALFSSPTFDATQVDPLSVTLASAPVRLRGHGQPATSTEDVNNDGLNDLLVQVSTEALQLLGTDTMAVLDGQTFGGIHFQGTDSVRVIE